MLAAVVALVVLGQSDPRDHPDGFVIDVLAPTLYVVLPYDSRLRDPLLDKLRRGQKVKLPTFRLRLDQLIEPDRKSPVYAEALSFCRKQWGIPKAGFTISQAVEQQNDGPTIASVSVSRRNRHGEWLGHLDTYHSEPSVDFQFRTWTESFDEELISLGFVRLGNLDGMYDVTKKHWIQLEAEAKQKKVGIWSTVKL